MRSIAFELRQRNSLIFAHPVKLAVIDCHADCSKAIGVQETSNCGGMRENCRGGMLVAMSTGTTRDNTSLDGIFRVSWFRRWNAQSVLSGACDKASVAKNLTFAITEVDVCKTLMDTTVHRHSSG
jgi:hypothetical protein